MLLFVKDSLRSDGTATIVTVYETDDDGKVGLWQIGSGTNQSLWLNSQSASYDDFSINYRKSNDHGVVIHSMRYLFPKADSTYSGLDTIFIGSDGEYLGEKNFCAFYYFPGVLNHRYQRLIESTLAIRYGALLHDVYLNSSNDTLWNPIGADSLYSFGIIGIGRDDSLSLYQPQSTLRHDILCLESAASLSDRDYIILGADRNPIDNEAESVVIDSNAYYAVGHHWKLRARTHGQTALVRLKVNLPIPATMVRLMIASADGSVIYTSSAQDSLKFDSIMLSDSSDYYVTLLISESLFQMKSTGGINERPTTEDESYSNIQIAPNPTTGQYILTVAKPDEDIVNVRVIDATGRLVDQYSSSENLTTFTHKGNIPHSGIYYVTVTTNGKKDTLKLVVIE